MSIHRERVQDAALPDCDPDEHIWRSIVPPNRMDALFWLCENCEAVTERPPQ